MNDDGVPLMSCSHPVPHYPSWCCEWCGAQIGWLGRAIDFLTRPFGFVLHDCIKSEISEDVLEEVEIEIKGFKHDER